MNILTPLHEVATPPPNFPVLDLGLVYSETSVPSNNQIGFNQASSNHSLPILLDTEKARLKNLRRSVLTAARLHVQQRSKWRVCMLTLTYAPENCWAPYQVTGVIQSIRKYLDRKDVDMRFVWVQEFTKKGRPHYHVLIWLPLGLTLPKPDKRGWWPYGMTKVEWARNAIGYIAKYASKADSLHRPASGARMHGSGGLTGDALLKQRWWKLPAWAREIVSSSDHARRAKGGGIVVPETGEILCSPWIVTFHGGHIYIQKTLVTASDCLTADPPDFDEHVSMEACFYSSSESEPFANAIFNRSGCEHLFTQKK